MLHDLFFFRVKHSDLRYFSTSFVYILHGKFFFFSCLYLLKKQGVHLTYAFLFLSLNQDYVIIAGKGRRYLGLDQQTFQGILMLYERSYRTRWGSFP